MAGVQFPDWQIYPRLSDTDITLMNRFLTEDFERFISEVT